MNYTQTGESIVRYTQWHICDLERAYADLETLWRFVDCGRGREWLSRIMFHVANEACVVMVSASDN